LLDVVKNLPFVPMVAAAVDGMEVPSAVVDVAENVVVEVSWPSVDKVETGLKTLYRSLKPV